MRNSILLIIISLLLCSCKIGGKNIHKTNEDFQIKKIGFVNLECKNALSTIFPQYNSIYISTVFETFKEFIADEPKYLNIDLSYDNTDMQMIKELCKVNNIDGLIISNLKFLNKKGPFKHNITTACDIIVVTKFVDKEGKVITTASYILPKIYYNKPLDEVKIIQDATKPTLRRMANGMGLKKNK